MKKTENLPEIGVDVSWDDIDGDMLKAYEFIPLASIEKGKVKAVSLTTPYALVHVKSSKLNKNLEISIVNKKDFSNLVEAFRLKKDNQELILGYDSSFYRNKFFKAIKNFYPKWWIMLCKKDAFNLITNKNYKPELTGETRYLAEAPIKEWKPDLYG